tara:strand:+ start:21970 stop:22836 length:867 start_codon:yes stop_codon:yes gene_type:complete
MSIFIFALLSCGKNKKEGFYKTTNLKAGFPQILEPVKKNLPFKIVSYSILETKNDSLSVYFGKLRQGNHSGNWLALSSNGQLKQFSTIEVATNPKTDKENNFDMEFNNSQNRISLRIKSLDTISNSVVYSWSNPTTLTDTLNILTIDRPLRPGNSLPLIEFTNLKGENYTLDDFKGQTIVLNWWAVSCAPCREEIPGLNKLVAKYRNRNVKFIAIADDSKANVSRFLEKNDFEYDIVFASEKARQIFGNSYPKNVIIDSTHTVTYYSEGGNKLKWKEIDEHLTMYFLK